MDNVIAAYNGSMEKGCWLRLKALAHFIASQGHTIHLVVPAHFDVGARPGVVKVPVETRKSRLWGLAKIKTALTFALVTRRLTKQLANPAIVSFDTHNGLSFVATPNRALKALFIRGETHYQAKYNEPFFYGLFIRAMDRLVKARADTVVYNNSPSMRREAELLGKYQPMVHKIPNDSKVAPQCRIARNPEPFTIGYCGQLSKRKNVEFLIRAFLELERHQQQACRLIIQGNWQAYSWVEDYLDAERYPNIHFRDWGPDTEAFYRDIDLFVLPSLFDDFSNAALDAIANGIPVLLSATGGSPEMVEGNPRLLFDLAEGEAALANRIGQVMGNYREMCREVGVLSANYSFDWAREVFGHIKYVHNNRKKPASGRSEGTPISGARG
ncbi:glycosyltransferase family 4 protein [Halomonas sp. HP20-15]|uniref:glycosyltransferase family 4 protein n=1 Tax=Halomonas sp. HP20-15 TaxID=3085901 RepID=UPI0029825F67|nr:glycosyltransferase family 4 protein [Halomonas sp. HP20-15]MDW5375851.1 glycosyltransferase family 4 protein [Halomonas sp. HP20-15]